MTWQGDISWEKQTERDKTISGTPDSTLLWASSLANERIEHIEDVSQHVSCVCVGVTSAPVSIVGDKHPLSDLPFNFLVNSQQHDSIKVESLTLGGKENIHMIIINFYSVFSVCCVNMSFLGPGMKINLQVSKTDSYFWYELITNICCNVSMFLKLICITYQKLFPILIYKHSLQGLLNINTLM